MVIGSALAIIVSCYLFGFSYEFLIALGIISLFVIVCVSDLSNLIIPDSVEYNNVTYPVTAIGSYAFCRCTNITSIKFPSSIKWAASFSESIGYGSYKCSKSDCTQELITAIKKTWTWLIMKEKSSNGSHYRAVVMKHFTQMWVWIAIDKYHNRYYVVFHYWVNF